MGEGIQPADLGFFSVLASAGSLSAAARELGITTPAVSRHLAQMEARLGVGLVNRTTRRMGLTPEGELYLEHARRILGEIQDLGELLGAAKSSPQGLLRVNATLGFGRTQIAPLISRFVRQHPGVDVQLQLSVNPPPLTDDAFDVCIRFGAPPDARVIARHIAPNRRLLCASPAYLKQHGTPRTPDDLQRHNCLWITSLPALRRWPFDTADGIRVVHIGGNVVANNAETVLQLAVAGVGITRLADVIVGEALRRGALIPILTDWHHVEPVPLFVTYPSGRHLAPKVRVMVDFLVEEFGRAPWRV